MIDYNPTEFRNTNSLKHMYQRRVCPGLLVGGLGFAFGQLGSLPLAQWFFTGLVISYSGWFSWS